MKKLILIPLASIALADSEWNTDLAYGCWTDKHHTSHAGLLHVQGTQRLIPGCERTWLRTELSASWASHGDSVFGDASHADYFGPHDVVLPEIALTQYFASQQVSLTAGMLNLANDVDAVGIANDSFATFAHSSFVNSTVLPLPDSNAGAVLRVEFTGQDSAVLAVSRTGSPPGGNPFRSGPPGCCVVGEYAHTFENHAITLRLNPFYHHHYAGVAGSVEYDIADGVSLFSRAGTTRHAADFSCGATIKPIPSRPDDFLGLAYARTKAETCETALELMYNLQLTDRFKLMPHLQYTRSEGSSRLLLGLQAVFSF